MRAAEGPAGGCLPALGSYFVLRISAVSGVAGHLVRLTDLWFCPYFCEGLIQFLKLSSLSWEALCRLLGIQH